MKLQIVHLSKGLEPWTQKFVEALPGTGTVFLTDTLRGLGAPGLRSAWKEIDRAAVNGYAMADQDILWRIAGQRPEVASRWFIRRDLRQQTPLEKLKQQLERMHLRLATLDSHMTSAFRLLADLEERCQKLEQEEAEKQTRTQ